MKNPEYANLREAMFAISSRSFAAQRSVANLRAKMCDLPMKDRSDIEALAEDLTQIECLAFDLPVLVGKAIAEAIGHRMERWLSALGEIRSDATVSGKQETP